MRKKNNTWIEDLALDASDILSKFSFGKKFESGVTLAHDLKMELRSPLWFSTTRFALYAHKVLAHFLHNYVIYRRVLEEVAESDDLKACEAEKSHRHSTQFQNDYQL